MAISEKPSVSGLMKQSHEVSRLENLFFKRVNSAYYFKEWGLDWEFFLGSKFELPIEAFTSYLTQDAMTHGILIQSIRLNIEDFTLKMVATVEGITFETAKKI